MYRPSCLGHSCVGHSCVGHNYIGHNYTGSDEPDLGVDDINEPQPPVTATHVNLALKQTIKENAEGIKRVFRFYMSHGVYNMERSRFPGRGFRA